MNVRKIYARWKPHILTDQNRVRVHAAKQLQKCFPNSNTFFNIVTVDETWVHYFEPVRKLGNKNGKFMKVKVLLMPKKKKHNLKMSY